MVEEPITLRIFLTLPVPRQKIIKKYFSNHVSPTSIKSVSIKNDLLVEIIVNEIINRFAAIKATKQIFI